MYLTHTLVQAVSGRVEGTSATQVAGGGDQGAWLWPGTPSDTLADVAETGPQATSASAEPSVSTEGQQN